MKTIAHITSIGVTAMIAAVTHTAFHFAWPHPFTINAERLQWALVFVYSLAGYFWMHRKIEGM